MSRNEKKAPEPGATIDAVKPMGRLDAGAMQFNTVSH